MRLIFDTNILISALLSPLGAPAQLLDAWERKRFSLVACDAHIAELRDVAGRPFFRARLRASVAELLAAHRQSLEDLVLDYMSRASQSSAVSRHQPTPEA